MVAKSFATPASRSRRARPGPGCRECLRAILLLTPVLVCVAAQAAGFIGRPIAEILAELRSENLVFIHNTRILPATLRVQDEPGARAGIALAREILAAHGLELSPVAPGIYAVIATPDQRSSADTIPSRSARSRPTTLEEIVVQTSRYTLSENVVARTFLTADQVQNLPKLADETLRAVQRLPGVTSNGFSSLGAVRGGEGNETAIILDGLRLYEPFHLKNFLSPVSLLDSRMIGEIEFYSGGFPSIYGDRMSAIIEATSVRPREPRYYEVGVNAFHASALASMTAPDGRGRGLISARRSNAGDLARYLGNENIGELAYADGFARLEYEVSERTRASIHALMSRDAVVVAQAGDTQRAEASYRNVHVWGVLDHHWSDGAHSRVIASYTDLENRRRGEQTQPGIHTARVRDEREFEIAGIRVENTFDTELIAHRFGIEARRLWGQYDYESEVRFEPDYPFPGSPGLEIARSAAPEPAGFETSAYWDGRADFGDAWTVQAGARVDTQTYDGSHDGAQWSPRLSLLYALRPRTRLRASWGRFFQAQAINELQVEDGVDRFHPAQFADHLILGLDHSFATPLDIRVEVYRKSYHRVHPRYENLFDPLVLLPETEFDRVSIDPQGARAHGAEVLLQVRQHGPWSGWLGYTWARAEDRIDGRIVSRSWDQRHAINLGVVWSRGPWTIALTDSFHTGWPTTALRLSYPSGTPEIDTTLRNQERFAFYNTLDLRVTRTFALARGALDVFVEANNAASRGNPCCLRYAVTRNPDGSLTAERRVATWLPLIPSLGVLWRY